MIKTITFALLVLAFTMPAFAKQSKTQQVGEMTLTSEDAKNLFKTPGHSPYAGRNFPTSVYWGDTHLHTSNSLDGRAFGVTASTELFRNGFHPAAAHCSRTLLAPAPRQWPDWPRRLAVAEDPRRDQLTRRTS